MKNKLIKLPTVKLAQISDLPVVADGVNMKASIGLDVSLRKTKYKEDEDIVSLDLENFSEVMAQ